MKKLLILICIPAVLFSCKNNKQDKLIGRWHATAVENQQMEALLVQGQQFIDTIGNSTDAATNVATYGTSNMDSMRHVLQLQLDSVKMMQAASLKNTWFTFRKDGTAILTFNGLSDSTKWSFDKDGALMLDDMKEKGAAKVKLQIIALEDTLLKLQLTENGMNSSVSFHPEGK